MLAEETRGGVVTAVEPGGRLRVRVEPEGGGEHCHACPLKGLCGGRGENCVELTVVAPADLAGILKVGDAVRLAYRPARAWASIALFLPLLVGLFAGGAIGLALRPDSDVAYLAGCGVGAALGVGVTFVLSRLFRFGAGAELVTSDPGRDADEA